MDSSKACTRRVSSEGETASPTGGEEWGLLSTPEHGPPGHPEAGGHSGPLCTDPYVACAPCKPFGGLAFQKGPFGPPQIKGYEKQISARKTKKSKQKQIAARNNVE